MKASEKIQWLKDDDIIILPNDIENLYIQCCDCGLWHLMKIDRKDNGDIHFQFIRLNDEPNVDKPQSLKFAENYQHGSVLI